MDHNTFDFIIVGGGTAGCALAASVARSQTHPSILLLEAGGDNKDLSLRIDGDRQWTATLPGLDWGYKTTPQTNLNNRDFSYFRGKGLGGSSATNLEVYTIGPKDDYSEWAERVGDTDFAWESIKPRFRELENYHEPRSKYRKYVAGHESDHGQQGNLHIGFAETWEKDIPEMLDVFEKIGLEMNKDFNSGNPIGMGISPNSAFKGRRSTSADLLHDAPPNLVVKTDTRVTRVILQDGSAVGVETEGAEYLASKEIILSAGVFDSPKLLLHSGIGPAKELREHGIPVVHDLPFVGKNMRDHLSGFTLWKRANGTGDRGAYFSDQAAAESAKDEWLKSQSGPLSTISCTLGIGFFKLDSIFASKEFSELPKQEQDFLQRETVPVWEILSHNLFPQGLGLEASQDYWALLVILLNLQSRGEVRLQSSNPTVPLLYDPKYLTHPYDRRLAIEAGRAYLKIVNSPEFQKAVTEPFMVPQSDSEEDVLNYFLNLGHTAYHAQGTVKMGKTGDPETCVDSNFSVAGLKKLRVADMSVAPLLFNNHPQSTAYVMGATLAEKLVKEYGM